MKAIGTRKACPGWMGSLSFLSPGSAWTTAGTTHGHDPTPARPDVRPGNGIDALEPDAIRGHDRELRSRTLRRGPRPREGHRQRRDGGGEPSHRRSSLAQLEDIGGAELTARPWVAS
jgi:hypothetical protein